MTDNTGAGADGAAPTDPADNVVHVDTVPLLRLLGKTDATPGEAIAAAADAVAQVDEEHEEENRNLKRFMGGRMTPMELHALIGGMKCPCGRAATTTIRLVCLLQDFIRNFPTQAAVIASHNPHGAFVPSFPTKWGQACLISDLSVCKACGPTAERTAAKHPDWTWVEIDRGPGEDKPFTTVSRRFQGGPKR